MFVDKQLDVKAIQIYFRKLGQILGMLPNIMKLKETKTTKYHTKKHIIDSHRIPTKHYPIKLQLDTIIKNVISIIELLVSKYTKHQGNNRNTHEQIHTSFNIDHRPSKLTKLPSM